MTSSQLSRLLARAAAPLQNLGFPFLPGIFSFLPSFVLFLLATANNAFHSLPCSLITFKYKQPREEISSLAGPHFGSCTPHTKDYRYTRKNFWLQSKSNPNIYHEPVSVVVFPLRGFLPGSTCLDRQRIGTPEESARLLRVDLSSRNPQQGFFSHDVRLARWVKVF